MDYFFILFANVSQSVYIKKEKCKKIAQKFVGLKFCRYFCCRI